MAELRQKFRGTTLQLDQYIGLEGQIAVDTQTHEIRVFDGSLMGGYKIPTVFTATELFQLPDRLKPTGQEFSANLNDALEAGFYRTTATTTNQPDDTKIGFVLVEVGDADRVKQTWTDSTGELTYTRVFDGGATWSTWLRVVDLTLGDGRYLGITAKAVDSNLLDGQEGAWYADIVARLGYTPVNKAGDTFTGTVAIAAAFPTLWFTDTDAASGDFVFQTNAGVFSIFADRDSNGTVDGAIPLQLDSVNNRAYAWGGLVWHSDNDGPGSTLDADTVDTLHASSFARVDIRSFFNTPTAMASMATATGSLGEFEVGSGGTDAAAIAFSRSGFGAYFGLDNDNKFKRGGWSLGANAYEIWDAGNQPVATASTPNTLMKRDGSGDVQARLFRSEYDSTNGSIGFIMTQVDTDTNNYIRPSTPAQVNAGMPAATDSTQGMMSAADKTFLGAPAAGNVFCKKLQEVNVNLVSSNFIQSYLSVEVTGTIRITGSHRGGSGQVSTIQIWRNGTSIQSWTDSSGAFQNRSIDIAVTAGDVIRWRAGTNSDPDWGPANDWQVKADAFRHIGSIAILPAGV